MKTPVIVSLTVAGSLLALFLGETEAGVKCGRNMYAQECAPCNPICGQGPGGVACPDYCTTKPTLCKCKDGYVLPKAGSGYCIAKTDCPPPK